MIDFTETVKNSPSYRVYNGGSCIKKGIIYNNSPYMLKIESRNKKKIYDNNILSEYISSKIFSMIGLPTQEVILGKIYDNNKEKLCVACKDFRKNNELLCDFLSIKNSIGTKEGSNGSGTELNEILEAIDKQKFYPANLVRERFWQMFVVDAYLGNFDRHNGNWGFLMNEQEHKTVLAPIYDCGSCLYSQGQDIDFEKCLNDTTEMNKRIYNFPRSSIRNNDSKIVYHLFLKETHDKDCLTAVRKIVPNIQQKENAIFKFINSINELSSIRKNFYTTVLSLRKEKILLPALERANDLLINQDKYSLNTFLLNAIKKGYSQRKIVEMAIRQDFNEFKGISSDIKKKIVSNTLKDIHLKNKDLSR